MVEVQTQEKRLKENFKADTKDEGNNQRTEIQKEKYTRKHKQKKTRTQEHKKLEEKKYKIKKKNKQIED